MPVIGTKACLTTKFFVQGTKKVMSFTAYWENDEGFTPTQAIMESIADNFYDEVKSLWANLASAAMYMQGCQAIYEKTTTFWEAMSTGAIWPGSIAVDPLDELGGDLMPDHDALIIQRRTGKKGRNNAGRMFVPGIDEDVNRNGIVDPDHTGDADNLAAFFGADFTIPAGEAAGLVFHARHWDRKTPDLVPIIDARWVNLIGTRRDRQFKAMRFAR